MIQMISMSSMFFFLYLLNSLTSAFASSQECTQGFMDYELLSVKAAQIGDTTLGDTVNGLNQDIYVIPSLNFNCSGTITGFLLAVDVRIDSGRNKYPWIALFNRVDSNTYSLVSGSKRDIELGPDNFSTSGLYNYTLSSPMQFTSGNIIGVRQRNTGNSVVRLQEQSYGTDDIEVVLKKNGNKYDRNKYIQNSRLLILPITDIPQCLSDGFISYEDLQVNARLSTSVSGSYSSSFGSHIFYKQIGFTCNCSITHVIAGMRNTGILNPSAVTIWRKSNTNKDDYTQSGPTIPLNYSDAVSDISTDYLRWYNLSVPVPVIEGDVLGVYFYTPIDESDALIYYQVYSGPHNYYVSSASNQATGYNAYPLVSVIVSGAVESTTAFVTETTTSAITVNITTTTTTSTSAITITPSVSSMSITTTSSLKSVPSPSNTSFKTSIDHTSTSSGSMMSSDVLLTALTTTLDSTSVISSSTPPSTATSYISSPIIITTATTATETLSGITFNYSNPTGDDQSKTISMVSVLIPISSDVDTSRVNTMTTAVLDNNSRRYTVSSSMRVITRSSSVSDTSVPPIRLDEAQANNSNGSIVPMVAGTLVSVTVLVAIIIAVIVVILVVIKRKKRSLKGQDTLIIQATDEFNGNNGIINAVYQSNDVSFGDDGDNGGITNNLYSDIMQKQPAVSNKALCVNLTNPMYQDVDLTNKPTAETLMYEPIAPKGHNTEQSNAPHYDSPSINHSDSTVPVYFTLDNVERKSTMNTLDDAIYEGKNDDYNDSTKLYNSVQSGVYVPTQSQRQEIAVRGDVEQERIYAVLESTYGSLSDCEEAFFKEEPIYWDPDDSTEGVYEQLAQRRYREIPRHEIRLVSHLGSGQFGTVDKGIWDTPKGPVEVAVKTLSGSITEEDEVKFLQEAAINGQFHHPNVVQLCGVVTVGQPTMIVLEYITHGDLKSFLEGLRPTPGELPDASLAPLLFKFSHQVACGMAYLSRKKFIHRDLAARNILVDNGAVCKIADFGMSRNLQDETYYRSQSKRIPVKWTAPEAIYYRKYTTQSDVWSFGALLYEIWSVGYKPFEQYTNQECIKLIESGYRLPSPSGCPRAVYQIMINCWNPVPSDRPSFDSLKSLLSSYPQSLSSPSDHPLSNLGSSVLLHDQSLYPELQNKYQ